MKQKNEGLSKAFLARLDKQQKAVPAAVEERFQASIRARSSHRLVSRDSSKIVIVACGQAKQTVRATAEELYTGSYYRACMAYAQTLAPHEDIYILSAKWGLLRLSSELEPYNVTLGESGSIKVAYAQVQAQRFGIYGSCPVVLGGQRYSLFCQQVFSHIVEPLRGIGGMGKQIAWLRRQAAEFQVEQSSTRLALQKSEAVRA